MSALEYDALHWEEVGGDLMPLETPLPINYPAESEVALDVVYGYSDQYTGTYEISDQPDTPTVVGVDVRDGDTATLTVTGSDALSTNYVYVSWWGQRGIQEWRLYATLSGDDSATINLPQGIYACKVKSQLGSGSFIESIGNLFYVSDASNLSRTRIRDHVATSALRIAKRLGALLTYQSPGQDEIDIWASTDGSNESMSMLGGETGTISLVIHVPRQPDFPPEDGLVPGARVGINGEWFAIDRTSFGTETIDLAPVFTMALRRYDISVEIDGDDV